MSKLVKETENALHTLVLEALGKAIAAGELPEAQMLPFIETGDYYGNRD